MRRRTRRPSLHRLAVPAAVSSVTGWVDGHQLGPSQDQAASLRNFFREWSGIGFWAMSGTTPSTVVIDDVSIREKS